ncbi:uncharacterized protein LOC115629069 [Scaptodrosophila lebanonensis]|uniref:Uncharacterized protein LOC115629069 n=1 Tax=Drosophila lebanonensis TaxID=7225 RepID=A0A6J2U010_DROLE|nr:uncharacterized protein LOC115629069 [Scaptodrosophila lebanonensis]
MYSPGEHWYDFWTKHIINDVKSKCINTPGVSALEGQVRAVKYDFLLDYDEIFSDCREPPENSQNIHSLVDLSELSISFDGDSVHVSGNFTSIWDVEPTDRIVVSVKTFQFKRGNWEPTFFSYSIGDFCSRMYGPDEYWYDIWSKHIINDVKSKCINTPGTLLILEEYDVNAVFDVGLAGPSLSGLLSIVVKLEAFDKSNRKRPTTICFEVRGEMVKKYK